MKTPEPSDTTTFEEAMERLESLVEQMESAQLPLAELITRYEEGNKLLQLCSKQLEAAELRVQQVTRANTGKPQVVPFEKADANPETAPSPARQSSRTVARVVADPEEEISLF